MFYQIVKVLCVHKRAKKVGTAKGQSLAGASILGGGWRQGAMPKTGGGDFFILFFINNKSENASELKKIGTEQSGFNLGLSGGFPP